MHQVTLPFALCAELGLTLPLLVDPPPPPPHAATPIAAAQTSAAIAGALLISTPPVVSTPTVTRPLAVQTHARMGGDTLAPMLDAVVIGGGHNGLVAAAYLARAGLSVELHERREIVGGACVTEELWPGVRASPGAYTLSLLRPEIMQDLQLGLHGLSVSVHEPYLFAPFPDGRHVVTWSERQRTWEQLERDWSRADADGYAAWAERWEEAPAGPAAGARARRPRALAGGRRSRDPRRADRRRAVRDPVRGGARAVRPPGADRHARRPVRPGHGLRRLLPRARPGHRLARGVGLRARGHGRGHRARCGTPRRWPGCACVTGSPVERVLVEVRARRGRGARGRRRAARPGGGVERRPAAHRGARRAAAARRAGARPVRW